MSKARNRVRQSQPAAAPLFTTKGNGGARGEEGPLSMLISGEAGGTASTLTWLLPRQHPFLMASTIIINLSVHTAEYAAASGHSPVMLVGRHVGCNMYVSISKCTVLRKMTR